MVANEGNLIPFNEMTESQQRAIQSAGGKASQEARKKRKAMREQAELLLSLPFQDIKTKDANGNTKSLLAEFKKISGIEDDSDIDNQMAMVIALWKQVLSGGKGSVIAFNSLRDLVGEKPKEVIEIHNNDETVRELEKIIEAKKGE